MPEKRFMPRRLHKPVPLVWNLTGPQVLVMIVSFALLSVFIITARTVTFLILGVVIMGIVLGGEYILFQAFEGTERSLLKHLVSKFKYGMKVPERYSGR